MTEAGLTVRGFRGALESDLPQGSGLSSSAALELASALALSGGEEPPVDRMRLARIAQRAENEYVGVACGLMDQFASAFGREGAALMLDCRSLEHREVPLALDGLRSWLPTPGLREDWTRPPTTSGGRNARQRSQRCGRSG